MGLLKFVGMGLAGLGIGLGLGGSTPGRRLTGWIMVAAGFYILEYLGVKL